MWVDFMRQNVWDSHSGAKSLAQQRENLSMVVTITKRESINVLFFLNNVKQKLLFQHRGYKLGFMVNILLILN